jgi:S-adenosylmethionine:tRNA ribosyltransferase-isomerase
MTNPDLRTESYDYVLPSELIASSPVHPADSAKLLVYNRSNQSITHTTFAHLLDFIPLECAICLNDTKVIKARIFGKKESGGAIELLLNRPLSNNQFQAMIRGRVMVGSKLYFDDNLIATVEELFDDGSRVVSFTRNNNILDFTHLVEILNTIGHVPLPPYIHRDDTKEDITEYQSLFASVDGAVAAPTASLHFTPELLALMKEKYQTQTLTLHVGAGTFKPVDCDDILLHPMHSEQFDIPQNALNLLKSEKKILAIGTTVTRTVEYHARTGQTNGECNLFLHPQNMPQRVDYLLTNFHLPKSTLIMLVASFMGRKETIRVYNEAIKEQYRFFSYGDALLIL